MTPDRRTCFVAMPIRTEGTKDFNHFRAIYDQGIHPTVSRFGYSVIRADDIQGAGSITKDIIDPLANFDVVIADLTDLNPNVFYELGIRHALVGLGTIMIRDRDRTTKIPFDVSNYRVIDYAGDLEGIGALRDRLTAYLETLDASDAEQRDNPVHHWLPTLPIRLVSTTNGEQDADLQRRLRDMSSRLDQYEKKYGREIEDPEATTDPLRLIQEAVADAEAGLLPNDIFVKATNVTQQQDAKSFLKVVEMMLARSIRLTSKQLIQLARYSRSLGVDKATRAIFNYARELYPDDQDLGHAELQYRAHSIDAKERQSARTDLMAELGIQEDGESYQLPDGKLTERDFGLFAILLDTFQTDKMAKRQLALTEVLVGQYPDSTIVTRNHARALVAVDRTDEALEFHRQATWCPDADDTSATWLGNFLHNNGRTVDAMEAYLFACLFDPDDAAGYAHAADELARAMREAAMAGVSQVSRPLPDDISDESFGQLVAAAQSCPATRPDAQQRLFEACVSREVDLDSIEPLEGGRLARVRIVEDLYRQLQSDLTRFPEAAGGASDGVD